MRLQLLMQWWPGQYDNHEQIVRQSGGGLPAPTNQPFPRVHSRYEHVTGSPLGDNVISMVDYLDDDPSQPIRTRRYVLSVDKSASALRLAQYAPSRLGAASSPSARSATCCCTSSAGSSKAASRQRPAGPAANPPNTAWSVGPRYTWFRERPGHDWFEQTRARPFTCMVQENSEGEMLNTRFLKTIRLHDQGGQADIAWPDGRDRAG